MTSRVPDFHAVGAQVFSITVPQCLLRGYQEGVACGPEQDIEQGVHTWQVPMLVWSPVLVSMETQGYPRPQVIRSQGLSHLLVIMSRTSTLGLGNWASLDDCSDKK